MNKLFSLVEHNATQVILKVKDLSNLELAQHPEIEKTYDCITLIKGKNKTLIIRNKDGSSFSFSWGERGYDLISERLEMLKRSVIDYVQNELHIIIEVNGWTPATVDALYNPYYNKYELICRNKGANAVVFSDNACSINEIINEFRPQLEQWGITHWKEDWSRAGLVYRGFRPRN